LIGEKHRVARQATEDLIGTVGEVAQDPLTDLAHLAAARTQIGVVDALENRQDLIDLGRERCLRIPALFPHSPFHPLAKLAGAKHVGVRLEQKEELFRGSADRKSTRLNSSHVKISYAVFCLKKKKK